MTDSPFDGADGGARSGRVRRYVLSAGMVLAAVLLAWAFTRDASIAEPSDEAGHRHGAPAAAGAMDAMFSLDTAAARRIGVTYATATRGSVTRTVRVPARVRIDETRRSVIAPRVDGWVEEVFVTSDGDVVRAGDPLFSLYSPMLVAAQEELLLARRLAGAERLDTTGSAAQLLLTARRKLEFWDVPAAEIVALEADGVVRRAITLRAPHDGIVLRKAIVRGEPLMPGAVALELADLSRVWIEAALPEQDLDAARVGAAATIEPFAGGAGALSGRVSFIAPVVDESARTVTVRIEVANAGGRLRPGGLATILLDARTPASSVTVPRSAVLVSGTRAIVFVRMPDGMLQPREVRLGQATDDRQVVLDGLAAGDVVVASAAFLVDAESNLRSALGAMAAMPGMEMPPPAAAPTAAPPAAHQHED